MLLAQSLRLMMSVYVEAVKSAGHEAVMTRADHTSGTDRIAEVAASLDDVDIIVNVQGDEPLISPLTIERAVQAMELRKGEKENGESESRDCYDVGADGICRRCSQSRCREDCGGRK